MEGGEKVRVDRSEAEAARRSRELVGRRKEYQAVKKFPSWQGRVRFGGRMIRRGDGCWEQGNKVALGWLQGKREGTIVGQVDRR